MMKRNVISSFSNSRVKTVKMQLNDLEFRFSLRLYVPGGLARGFFEQFISPKKSIGRMIYWQND
jgi:hypothetical protein